MIGPPYTSNVDYARFTNSGDFFDFLQDAKNYRTLRSYDFIHMSAHGGAKAYMDVAELPESEGLFSRKDRTLAFGLPRGTIDWICFPPDCFKGKVLTLSSCSMGRLKTMYGLFISTNAKYIVAPRYTVYFDDSLIWFANFYYLVLRHDYSAPAACRWCNRYLSRKMAGDKRSKGDPFRCTTGGFRLFNRDSL